MPITRAAKYLIYSITWLILTMAFVVSGIRRSFWLLATIPLAAYTAYKYRPSPANRATIITCIVLLFGVTYQPLVQLPSAGFIGFFEKMESHLNRLILHSDQQLTIKYSDIPREPLSAPDKYSDRFSLLPSNYSPVRPPQGPDKVVKDYFVSRRAMFGNDDLTMSVNGDKMVDMFPYEPIPKETSTFSFFTVPLSDVVDVARVPYPKHMIFLLSGFVVYTMLTSAAFAWLMRRTFTHRAKL